MFKRSTVAFMTIASFASLTSTASAQVSGEVSVQSSYIDGDLLPLTSRPSFQAGIYVDVSSTCSLDAWGSRGFTTSEGSELDIGLSCRYNFGKDTQIEISVYRDFLAGFSDMTEVSAHVTHGNFDIKTTQFMWDNNPDATRTTAGYNFHMNEKLTLRPTLVYQHGFDEADVAAAGLTTILAINDSLSLSASVYTPFAGDRNTEAVVGLTFAF